MTEQKYYCYQCEKELKAQEAVYVKYTDEIYCNECAGGLEAQAELNKDLFEEDLK